MLTFEYMQLTKFVRFIDFLHIDSKSLLMVKGIGSIIKMIDNMNSVNSVFTTCWLII